MFTIFWELVDHLSWFSQLDILSMTQQLRNQKLRSISRTCHKIRWTSLSHLTTSRKNLLRRSALNWRALDSKLITLSFKIKFAVSATKVILRVSQVCFYYFIRYTETIFLDSFRSINPFKMPEDVQTSFTSDCASIIAANCEDFIDEESELNVRYKLMISFVAKWLMFCSFIHQTLQPSVINLSVPSHFTPTIPTKHSINN